MTQNETAKIMRRIMRAASNMKEIEPWMFKHEYSESVFECDDPNETIDRAVEYIELANEEEGRQKGHKEAIKAIQKIN